MATSLNEYLLVAAIDFGTTFSGYGYSFRHQYDADPTIISGRVWRANTESWKAPTCILLKPDKTFDAFGYDAEDKYTELALENKHTEWYFFKHFKMKLFEKTIKKELKRDFELEDETGKVLPALMIFAMAIKHLKEDMMLMCRNQATDIKENDVRWVLTTPAIWSDAAKQFMREAAVKAGISGDSLVIALEPEVASIYCRHTKFQTCQNTVGGDSIATFAAGTRYAVLDAGGGALDITIHEVNQNGTVKEVHYANGGPWGGIMVDEEFRQFLIKIVGGPIMQKFKNEFMDDYLELMRDFEMRKRDIGPKTDKTIIFRVPSTLLELFEKETEENIEETISRMNIVGVAWKKDKLQLSSDTMRGFFESPVQNMIKHLTTLFDDEHTTVSHIVMVGGFSNSVMVQNAIRSLFRSTKVFVPVDANVAVLKGAVIYGHEPSSITHRKSRFTYGLECVKHFIEGTHDEKRKIVCEDGKVRCKHCFDIDVEIGQMLRCGDWQKEQVYERTSSDQEKMTWSMHASTLKHPTYVDEPHCIKLGELTIDSDNMTDRFDNEIFYQICYSGTEIYVRTRDRYRRETCKSSFNFLG